MEHRRPLRHDSDGRQHPRFRNIALSALHARSRPHDPTGRLDEAGRQRAEQTTDKMPRSRNSEVSTWRLCLAAGPCRTAIVPVTWSVCCQCPSQEVRAGMEARLLLEQFAVRILLEQGDAVREKAFAVASCRSSTPSHHYPARRGAARVRPQPVRRSTTTGSSRVVRS
jgi:hypothetical protein